MEGTIKIVNKDKGFGFIRYGRNNKEETFFHRSALGAGEFEKLHEGDKVAFEEPESSPKGLRTNAVERL